ncbi:MAG: hypothetical protein KME13_23855 [Myxacorys californica WJT36-NPBG1]|jgi:hypothetical protein|nr:hypothetical protein [Myxacorys californica WJT36-NPBG1]
MSNYHKDDDSSIGGVMATILVVIAFTAGYWIRDRGIIFQIQVPTEVRR